MNRRQVAFVAAKVIFAVAVIWWLFNRVDGYRVWACVRDAHRLPILGGLLLCFLTVAIAGWRWHRLLRIFDIVMPLRSLICIVQIGQFFTIFLPGPTGEDLTRILYISRLAPGRVGETFTTVLLDRFIGLSSVLLLAVCCIPWQWSLLATSHQTHWLAVAILSAGAIVCVGGAVFFLAGHPTHRWLEKRFRSRSTRSLRDEAARVWGLLCNNKMLVAKVISAALITQLIHCIIFYLASVAVGIRSPFLIWPTFIPIVLAANALPITIAGVGVREYLLVLFLGIVAGVDSERALATSFVIFSMILTSCLLGGLLYIFYRPKRKLTAVAEVSAPA